MPYLEQALRSCLDQTHSEIEIIVVDGGSVDGTLQIIERLASQRVRYIAQPANSGKLPGALNIGFAAARGDYLTWLSSDNYLVPDAIAKLLGYLVDHPDIDLVYSDFWRVEPDGAIIKKIEVGPPENIWYGNEVDQSFLFRRSVYARVGDHSIDAFPVQDYDYWVCVAKCCKLGRLQEPLQYYRVHDRSLTAQFTALGLARCAAKVRLDHGIYDARSYRHELSRIDMEAAFESHWAHDASSTRICLVRALFKDWRWLKNRGVYSIGFQALLGQKYFGILKRGLRRILPPKDN